MIRNPKHAGDKSPGDKAAGGKFRSPTMADLARIAGVSTITVSRALADSPLVNPDTVARIKAIAKEQGYAFNINARNLRLQRSMTVAVVVEMRPSPDRLMSGPYPLELLGGIAQELALAGYSLLLTSLQSSPLPGVRSADGIILLGQGVNEDAMHAVLDWGGTIPLAVWGAVSHEEGQVVVGSDNRHGGALVAERFLALGRTRPVFLGHQAHGEFAERMQGFRDTLQKAGIEPIAPETTGLTVGEGAQIVRHLLESQVRFDAVFAVSDLLAIGAMGVLIEHGKRVPEDVTVVGFDDTPLGASFVPALSSVHQNFVQAGSLLARKVLRLIDGQSVDSEVLPTHLVVRAT